MTNKVSLHIDLLGPIIDCLGEEARPDDVPSTSLAFQSLLACSLVCKAALHPSRTHIFYRISIGDTRKKPSCPSLRHYLQGSIDILQSHPHLVPYIQRLTLDGVDILIGDYYTRESSDRSGRTTTFNELFPSFLRTLTHLRSLQFKSFGGDSWRFSPQEWDMTDAGVRAALVDCLTRREGNLLREVELESFSGIPALVLRKLSPTVRRLHLDCVSFADDDVDADGGRHSIIGDRDDESSAPDQPVALDSLVIGDGNIPAQILSSGLNLSRLKSVDLVIERQLDDEAAFKILSMSQDTLTEVGLTYEPFIDGVTHVYASPVYNGTYITPIRLPNLLKLNFTFSMSRPNPDHPHEPARNVPPCTPTVLKYIHSFISQQPNLRELTLTFTVFETYPTPGRRFFESKGQNPQWAILDDLLADCQKLPALKRIAIVPQVSIRLDGYWDAVMGFEAEPPSQDEVYYDRRAENEVIEIFSVSKERMERMERTGGAFTCTVKRAYARRD
ncbi:hypothetical protein CC1G_11135 [Coprinopsis cinerea okayama7|uniref:Uncharacterized protein n=1 Tax=Coprinopsis cinerea (strain Okayama-7 / 130 / ATCC MYA-4618 / FGSC 9003) TaxID=240176 RepID=A8N4S0_COPC7|nr:hypothetical protein CC1G_11135 [Coprinopsis cinerea okayama7\|eukprot:XP_001829865.1 hypothetical protein CC1G_11135 [Coprinopsis cinerea okayama7\